MGKEVTADNLRLQANMAYYEAGRKVPVEATKTIQAGKIKGFTDVNPMWRIKKLTELFGPCGIGWVCPADRFWLEPAAEGEVKAFCTVQLRYKVGDGWSEPVLGIGGSTFIARTKNGLEVSDECYKMAYTDAISVACKSLGIAADVYYAKDRTKYDQAAEAAQPQQQPRHTDGDRSRAKAAKKAERPLLVQGGGLWKKVVDYFTKWGDLEVVDTVRANYDISDADLDRICREISEARTAALYDQGFGVQESV